MMSNPVDAHVLGLLQQIACALEQTCDPWVGHTTGAAPDVLADIHQLDVLNRTCCDVTVGTTIGEFVVPAGQSFDLSVNCCLTVETVDVDGDCDLAEVLMVGVRIN